MAESAPDCQGKQQVEPMAGRPRTQCKGRCNLPEEALAEIGQSPARCLHLQHSGRWCLLHRHGIGRDSLGPSVTEGGSEIAPQVERSAGSVAPKGMSSWPRCASACSWFTPRSSCSTALTWRRSKVSLSKVSLSTVFVYWQIVGLRLLADHTSGL